MPLAAVLTGYRIGFDYIWHAIVAGARIQGSPTDAALLDIASTVWRMLGIYTTEMVNAYRGQQTEQRLDMTGSAQRWSRLFSRAALPTRRRLGFEQVVDRPRKRPSKRSCCASSTTPASACGSFPR